MEASPGTRLQLRAEEFRRRGRLCRVLRVVGEVDTETGGALRDAVRDALVRTAVEDGGVLLVDLREVAFLGASGVTALVEASRLAPSSAGPVRLVVDGNRPVARAAAITGLEQVFRLYEDLEDALADAPKALEH